MKKKVREEIKVKTIAELKREVSQSVSGLLKLKFQKSQNKLKNLRQIFNERKKIALMKTLIKEKEQAEKISSKITEKKKIKKNEK